MPVKRASIFRKHKSQVKFGYKKGRLVLGTLTPKLRVRATPTSRSMFPDERITYVITITNASELPVRDLVVFDEYPEQLQFVGTTWFKSEDSAGEHGGGVVKVFVPGTLEIWDSVSVRITFRLTDDLQAALAEGALSAR